MSGLFQECNLTSLSDLKDWCTSNVTEMIQIFEKNRNITSLSGIENWDVSKYKKCAITNFHSTSWNLEK